MPYPNLKSPTVPKAFFLFLAAACLAGCAKTGQSPLLQILTDSGPAAWDTTGTVNVQRETYLDRGESKAALALDAADSSRLSLVSPGIAVKPGQVISFRFACSFDHAMGEILQVRLRMFDTGGSETGDSLLYRIRGGSGEEDEPGRAQQWISYTRCLLVPEGVSAVKAEITSAPGRGKVRLGETALVGGEDWMAYAASFSSHLQKQPEDKYVFAAARQVEPQAAPQPTEQEKEAGMLFFERRYLIGAWPYANPRAEDRVEALAGKVPAQATASFAFGVKALEDLSGVSVSLAGPLEGPGGELSAEPSLHQGKFVPARLGSSWGKEFGISVKLLTALEPKAIPAGRNAFYWVDIPVPPGASPGVYQGGLSIQAQGRPALTIPLELEVQPVVLPASHDYVIGMYYYPPDDPSLMEVHLKDMAAHGVYAVSLAGAFVEKDSRGGVRLDREKFAKLDTLMGLMRKHGFSRPTALFVQDLLRILEMPEQAGQWTEAHKNLYRRAIRLMSDTAESRRWCKLWFFPVDEPANHPELMELARLVLGILREMPGITPYCDLNSPESVLELSDYIDVICMQILSVAPRTVQAMKEKQVESFFYLPGFGWNPAFHRGIAGWFLPRSGARGIYYFAYQNVTGDPYDELDGTHRDWSTAYPAPEPYYIWPCPEWQGIRQGIEDLRLLGLSDSLAAGCMAAADERVRGLGRSAKEKTESIYLKVSATGPGASYQLAHDLEPGTFEQWRQEIIGQVLLMQKALE
ncbi:MAG: hypothetical protein JXQ83_05050 [Candidatus Glassbacteria bacterium]|nr:hypothetical protein [Candidatus Glassbacteria bacterium]